VFVNGRYAPDLSSAGTTDGLRIRSLREVLDREPQLVHPYLDRQASGPGRPFAALNIEGREGPAGSAGLAVEVGMDELGLAVEHLAQAADVQAVRGARGGEIRRVAAVDEHELAPREGVTEVDRVEHREVGDRRARGRAKELGPRDGGHARVPPVLQARGGKTQLLERANPRRAQGAQPFRLRLGKARAEGLELRA